MSASFGWPPAGFSCFFGALASCAQDGTVIAAVNNIAMKYFEVLQRFIHTLQVKGFRGNECQGSPKRPPTRHSPSARQFIKPRPFYKLILTYTCQREDCT